MTWASVEEVQQYTGIPVGSDNVTAAQFMIELFADVTEDSTHISTKNLRLLKMAVAYQAAWISDHPDVFTHVDISTMLQDGIQFSYAHANAGILAPMAKRALDRLSWKRNRSIKIKKRKQQGINHWYEQYGPGGMSSNNGSAIAPGFGNSPEEDDNLPWSQE